jgi:hypothetical protein
MARTQPEIAALPCRPVRIIAVAAWLALAACANSTASMKDSAMTTPLSPLPSPPVVTSGELAPTGDPVKAAQMNIKPVEWPLRFKEHNFDARCYDTLECSVAYDNFDHGDPEPTQPSSAYGPDYLKGWNGSYGGVKNFPPPAKMVWRTKDGVKHQAEIDIGEIFKDEVVLHHVPREEVSDLPDGKFDDSPSILLEVNGSTIRVYMSAMVHTKHYQTPGNKHSDYREDLILVKTYTF